MILLYNGGGATLTEVFGSIVASEEWEKLCHAVQRLLSSRGYPEAAAFLTKYPFELLRGTNFFQDEFAVLYAQVPLEQYVEFEEIQSSSQVKQHFRKIAETISEVGPFTRFIAVRLDTDDNPIPVAAPSPKVTSQAVEHALADAEQLIRSRGPISALDRVHTALHGYLRAILERAQIPSSKDASITELFKLSREQHSDLANISRHDSEAFRMIMAMATIIDSLTTLRNRASAAHPNEDMAGEPEAMLAINAARTLFNYLNDKVQS